MINEKEFDPEAVKTLANKMEKKLIGDDVGTRQTLSLFNDIAEISNVFDIPSEERTDFAIKSIERLLDRQKQKVVSDFRQQLEAYESIWNDE